MRLGDEDSARTLPCLLAVLVVSLVAGIMIPCAHCAPGENQWSTPYVVFETSGWTFNVATAVDSRGRLVAIWQYNPYKKTGDDLALSNNANDSLFLARLDGGTWSEPAEIMLGSMASSRLAVVTDQVGQIHLFSQNSCLWHAVAPIEQADRVQSWPEPECLAEGAASWPAATVSADGTLNLVFSEPSAVTLWFTRSEDDGRTWSDPQVVVRYDSPDLGLNKPALAEGPDGDFHVVWTEVPLPDGYPPGAIMYSRSLDRGRSWSEPISLANAHQGEATVVADAFGRVHVAWNGAVSDGGRYYVHSLDGGLLWEGIEAVLRGSGGLQYPPGLAVDSTGSVHVVFANDASVVYAVRDGERWSAPEEIYGPSTVESPSDLNELDSVRLQITNGNVLHTMYTRFRTGEVFHQWRSVDAPYEAPGAPTVMPTPTGLELQASPSPTTQLAKPTALVSPPLGIGQAPGSPSAFGPLVLPTLSVGVFLLVVIGLKLRWRR